jgi:nucleotide-binding universal stress UspA family protein
VGEPLDPEPDVPVSRGGGGGIVVGIDGSDHSEHALRWAIAEARLRHTPLHVVTSWSLVPALYGPVGVASYDQAAAEVSADAERIAQAAVDAARAAGIDVDAVVRQAHAADALIEIARDADLLVVGSRGHGGFAGLLLGSVSAQCAHHATCPVVIVR